MKINLLKISAISALILIESPAFAAFYKEAVTKELPKGSMQTFKAYVQQKAVTGTVTDEKSQPLPGAVVKNTKTGVSAQTDVNGKFIVQATEGDVITISYIGYDTQTITIGSQSTLSLQLKPSNRNLGEVVVIGYGTQNRDQVTTAVSTVKADEFRQSGSRNALDLVQGKVPGLSITRTGGSNPNSGVPSVQLRGATTLSGTASPLYVVDGIPIQGTPFVNGDGNQVTTNVLDLLQQDDIASVDVLKDGSAAAIYGTTANNGVIIITTKKGKEGKAQFDYSSYFRKEYVNQRLKFLSPDQYRQRIASGDIRQQDFGNSTDFFDQMINHDNLSMNHNFSMSGGSKYTTYRASINYRDLQGIAKENGRKEYTLRLNVIQTGLNDRLKVAMDVATNFNNANLLGGDGWVESELTKNPTLSNFNPDGSFRFDRTSTNEFARIQQETNRRKQQTTSASVKADLKIVEGLKASVFGSVIRNSYIDGAYRFKNSESSLEDGDYPGGGYAYRGTALDQSFAVEPTLEYNRSFLNKHNLTALAGYSYRYNVREEFNANNRNFLNDLLHEDRLGEGGALALGKAGMQSFKVDNSLIGVFGRLIYSYDSKYLFQASLRRDGSARFGSNNKWGYFPAVSAGWTITQEDFMKNVTAVNFLKLRVGYGVTGNSPIQDNVSRVTLGGGGRYIYPDGSYFETYGPRRNPNPNLKWETKKEINVGIDFTVLNNRLSGSIDVFNRRTSDLLGTYTSPQPPFVLDNIFTNVASLSAKGIEVALSYTAVKTKNFSWNMDGNVWSYKNTLKSFSNDEYKVAYATYAGIGGAGALGDAVTIYEGGPLGQFWGKRFAGFTADGKWLFYNRKGEAVPNTQINNSKDKNVTDLAPIGNAIPKLYASWTNNFAYKNWDLRLFFRGKFGFDALNTSALTYGNRTWSGNLLESTFTKYSQLNDTYQYSDYYIENASFVKLDEVTLGYNFKFKGNGIRNLRAYVTGQNLALFTGYKGNDPDLIQDVGLSVGVDNRSRYPNTRSILLGFNVGF
ncbi:SusC/RagA family TonB-linked outer membrane protein [Mucilaginibacter sp. Bleaf8]|uniref:SusC/RagA family TonB-linked outer membrane protein n=1 Tax=Mucilaginibacter sp. Bleaf8 TaxID=2834430 RepID=UPI001BD07348|nr:SusC/RagA family TonB-linked outer membrane protein [Mucilaginibacter sp. Bleaf8]MBS7566998.1 SusC/RagA family TonB-linked outer membrane protein [Mucilaginibacter sp. Bleaf8]